MRPWEQDRDRRRLFFDGVAEAYDVARPGYASALYDHLGDRGALGPGTRVLEVGCGTGQASLDLAARAASVTAVELGPNLAARARQHLAEAEAEAAGFAGSEPGRSEVAGSEVVGPVVAGRLAAPVEVLEGDALELDLPAAGFDLVASATAWHWLDPVAAVRWAHERLAPGGWLAVWWHVYGDPTRPDPFGDAIGPLLDQLFPFRGSVNASYAIDHRARRAELENGGWFGPVEVWTHEWEGHHDADDLARLFSTYSPDHDLDPADRARVVELVHDVATEQFGGQVTRPYVTALYLAPRRGGTMA